MSAIEMTFRQAERLIEEIKIILPTVENLLVTAKDVKDINILAGQNIRQLQSTIEEFDAVLLDAVATGIEAKIEKLKEFDEFEKRINKNVQIVKSAAERINPIQKLNCFLIFGIGFFGGAIAIFLLIKGSL